MHLSWHFSFLIHYHASFFLSKHREARSMTDLYFFLHCELNWTMIKNAHEMPM